MRRSSASGVFAPDEIDTERRRIEEMGRLQHERLATTRQEM